LAYALATSRAAKVRWWGPVTIRREMWSTSASVRRRVHDSRRVRRRLLPDLRDRQRGSARRWAGLGVRRLASGGRHLRERGDTQELSASARGRRTDQHQGTG